MGGGPKVIVVMVDGGCMLAIVDITVVVDGMLTVVGGTVVVAGHRCVTGVQKEGKKDEFPDTFPCCLKDIACM